jgi:uncharacterized protein YbaR (Trm112 family)
MMRIRGSLRKSSLLMALAFLLASFAVSFASAVPQDYSFKIHNNTKHAIQKVLVSEDKKKWGEFDIGDGIPAGATEELIWDKSTNGESCHQWFKAVFDNDEESEAVKFDFCEKGLVLEF